MSIPTLNRTAALVAIDLQNGIGALPVTPYTRAQAVAEAVGVGADRRVACDGAGRAACGRRRPRGRWQWWQ